MANAIISIQFNTLPIDGDSIQINIVRVVDGNLLPVFEAFRLTRIRYAVVLSECDTLENTAKAYAKYVLLDQGSLLFTISHITGTNIVTFTMNSPNFTFNPIPSTYGDLQTFTNDVPTIDVSTFTLGAVVFSEATIPANDVNISLTTVGTAQEVWLNGILVDGANVANPILLDVPRGIDTKIRLIDSQGIILEWGYNAFYRFPFLASGMFDVNITETLNGATLSAIFNRGYQPSPTALTELVFEYSLDNVNWQTSNIFSGQPSATYNFYVRDQYGVVVFKTIVVNGVDSTRDPYLFISKANALNFKEMVAWDGYQVFKNEDNTFEYQSLEQIKYCFPLLLQTNDKTKIQFKSNFTTREAILRKEDGTEVVQTITKETSNLNRFESLDAKYYQYSLDYTGVYFESGNKYDDLGFADGAYILNGNLPDLAIKGQLIEIVGEGVHEIVDLIFDPNINKKVILISSIYVGVSVIECIVKSTYDLLPFDVFEFEVDWSVHGIGLYDIVLNNSNDGSGLIIYASENISILAEHDETLAIRYYNKNNRDIFYKFGIEHFIRVPFSGIKRGFDEEFEVSRGDLLSAMTSSKLGIVDEYIFTDLTTGFMRTLCIALSCEFLFINNVGYIKNSSLEIEQIPNTNLYEVKASLLRTNVNYSINRQGQVGRDINYVPFDIPAFVYTGTGFLTT